RKLRHNIGKILCQLLNIYAEFLKDRQYNAFLLLDEGPQEVLGRNLGISFFLCMRLSGLKGLLALQRQLVKTDHFKLPHAIWICFGLACSFFGSAILKTPSL